MLLILEEPNTPKSGKRSLAFAFLTLSIFGLIGQTLASNVNLGSGAPLEFGQGIQSLVTCAPTAPITLTPKKSFVNGVGNSARFMFTGITLEGIQNTCIGNDFLVKAYGETGSPLPIFDNTKDSIRVYQSGNSDFSSSATDGFTIVNKSFGFFEILFDSPVSEAGSIYRLTIETLDHDSTMLRYDIGDTGPGGGMIVLLPTSLGNNSGEYFEAKSIVLSEIWCDYWPLDIPGTSGSAIGDGEANSYAMMLACNDTVANNASSYPGFPGDWFLPSRDELAAALNAGFVPLFGGDLWTSTQYDSDAAYTVSYPARIVGTYFKLGSLPAVAMRSFP